MLPVGAGASILSSFNSGVIGNGSFEDPNNGTSYVKHNPITSWKTTETSGKVEIVNNSGTSAGKDYMDTSDAMAADGTQFSTVVYDRSSSQFQTLSTTSGQSYTWSLSHRAGRTSSESATTTDVMALFIGAYPGADASTGSLNAYDQFTKIVNYLKSYVSSVVAPAVNSTAEYTVYSAPFAANGSFTVGDTDFCAMTEKDGWIEWKLILISSDSDAWHTYTGSYTAISSSTMFAMTNWSAHTGKYDDETNLIDAVSFANSAGDELLVNGSYETPAFTSKRNLYNSANSPNSDAGIGWSVSAYNYRVCLYHIKDGASDVIASSTPMVEVPDQYQFAEIANEQTSSLYQYIDTSKTAGSTYEWGLYHRGRKGVDTMAVVLGAKQSNDPRKTSAKTDDQLQQLVQWVCAQTEQDYGLSYASGATGISRKIVVYSAPFTSASGYTSTDPFAWAADEVHTQKWELWLVATGCIDWQAYGSLSGSASSCTYTVPEGQDTTMLAFVPVATASGDLFEGNLIDAVTMTAAYNLQVSTPSTGTATVSVNNAKAADVTSDASYLGTLSTGDSFSVTVTAGLYGTSQREFVGAYINGTYSTAGQCLANGWSQGTSGTFTTYTFAVSNVSQSYNIRPLFASHQIIYDANGGDTYEVDSTGTGAANELNYSNMGTSSTYTSHAAIKTTDGTTVDTSWKNTGWLYTQGNTVFDPVHTIAFDVTWNGTSPTFNSITIKNTSDDTSGSINPEIGAILVAQWSYQQAFTTQVLADGTYKDQAITSDASPFTVMVGSETLSPDSDASSDTTYSYYTAFGNTVSVSTNSIGGYTFKGWYSAAGDLLSANTTYEYTVGTRGLTQAYAHYESEGASLSVTKKLAGRLYETERYFRYTLNVSGATANTTYAVSGGTTGAIKYGNATYTNPTSVTTDATGAVSATFYIKGDETIVVAGLPKGCTYSVDENDYTYDGYNTSGEVSGETLGEGGANVTLTNTRVGAPCSLSNISYTSATNYLTGGTFLLEKLGEDNETYSTYGSVVLSSSGQYNIDFLPAGTYRVSQTHAPAGYSLLPSEEAYFTFTVKDYVITATATNHWALGGSATSGTILYCKNEIMYNLPTTGGIGIYPFVAAGSALMATSIWLALRPDRRRGDGL